MKTVILQRHGRHYEDGEQDIYYEDTRHYCETVTGKLFESYDIRPDIGFASPVNKARQSAEVMRDVLNEYHNINIEYTEDSAFDTEKNGSGKLKTLSNDFNCVAVMTHQPCVEKTSNSLGEYHSLDKNDMVVMQFDTDDWAEIRADTLIKAERIPSTWLFYNL